MAVLVGIQVVQRMASNERGRGAGNLLGLLQPRCRNRRRSRIDADPSRVRLHIYRDVRFSHDKSPYKTNLGTYFPHRSLRGAPGGLYVHVAPKESFVAAGFYQLDKEPLQRARSDGLRSKAISKSAARSRT
jgi:uncharacterized protein (TIGR02453 family)